MSLQHESDAEPESGLASTLSTLERLIKTLDPIATFLSLELGSSSETIAALRGGKPNDLLWCGIVTVPAAPKSFDKDYTVPFARIGYVDFASGGPFNFSTDATRAEMGPGTYKSFGADSGVIPFVGRHLSIWSAGDATPLFLVVFASSGSGPSVRS